MCNIKALHLSSPFLFRPTFEQPCFLCDHWFHSENCNICYVRMDLHWWWQHIPAFSIQRCDQLSMRNFFSLTDRYMVSMPLSCLPPNQPPEVLSTWRPTVYACAFRTNRCLNIFPKLKSATCSRDAIVPHKFPIQLSAVSHMWSSSRIWYSPLHSLFFFSVKAFKTVLLSNFKKKIK